MGPLGISVVICCYNSSEIIGETLQHLFKQKFICYLDWEIVIVNNASDDNTEAVVLKAIEPINNITCTIVKEPNPGLVHARIKGIETAQYEYILFCDDDNFLCDTYLQHAYS